MGNVGATETPMLSERTAAAIQAGATITGSLSLAASSCMLLLPIFAKGPRTLQYAMVRTLAAFNLVEAATFAVGRGLVSQPGEAVSVGCKAQGAIMQFSSAASFVWILFFCLVLVRSAGGSYDLLGEAASARTLVLPLLLTLGLAAAPCVVIAAADNYGDAALWCWVSEPGWAVGMYYAPLLAIWAVAIGSLAYVGIAVRRRVAVVLLDERARKWSDAGPGAESAAMAIAASSYRSLRDVSYKYTQLSSTQLLSAQLSSAQLSSAQLNSY